MNNSRGPAPAVKLNRDRPPPQNITADSAGSQRRSPESENRNCLAQDENGTTKTSKINLLKSSHAFDGERALRGLGGLCGSAFLIRLNSCRKLEQWMMENGIILRLPGGLRDIFLIAGFRQTAG